MSKFTRSGTKSHPLHRKGAIARKMTPGRRLWRLYLEVEDIFEFLDKKLGVKISKKDDK